MAELVVQDLSKQLGGRLVVDRLSLTVGSGELVCLLGPSGCGKTTTLRMIAGFAPPDGGRITIGDQDVTRLAPEHRPTAMVFQSYALWPNMTVFKNIAFGLRLRKLQKNEIGDRVAAVLKLVNLTGVERRHPAQLSGGEQQRVALARALVLEPELLLLDEPLSNLDAKLRVVVREEIREIQQRLKIATLFVTHDQDEALSISDRIAVMSGGRIEQFSDASDLYRRPASEFVAGFVGSMNFFTAQADGDRLLVGPDATPVPCPPLDLPEAEGPARWQAAVRPEDVRVASAHTDGPRPATPAQLVKAVPHGHFTELVLRLSPEVVVRAYVSPDFDTGDALQVTFGRVLLYQDGRLQHECGRPSVTSGAGVNR